MLVLSRKRSEQIVIGPTIRITVVKLEGNQVRLGIEAPQELLVLRAELLGERAPDTDDGFNPAGRSSP
jgi:carbon storage regulator